MNIRAKYNLLEESYPDILSGAGELIQKSKIARRFPSVKTDPQDQIRLETTKELCELKIIELWDNRDSEEFKALCSTYFDIATHLPIPSKTDHFVYERFRLIFFGYLGEHWHFVRQYLRDKPTHFSHELKSPWNKRILLLCYNSIEELVRKTSWSDVNNAVTSINSLREEQKNFEKEFLQNTDDNSRPFFAVELLSLYHFAKSIEILGQYLLEGRPIDSESKLSHHITQARDYSTKSGNVGMSLLLQYFEAFSIKMVRNTIWYITGGVNNWVTKFNKFISQQNNRAVFELLYPQRESILSGQLLNPSNRAIVINLPTSSGKTMIAEYRILQALNQFKQHGGWIAYIVPTRALVNQIYTQLAKDLGTIGLKIEKASGAIDLDGFEQHLIEASGNTTTFDILVTTYEKLSLLVRQGLGTTAERPLVLTVVDEAHNLEEHSRGLSLELLLSTIKNDCVESNFLLMTPDISNALEIADWLAGDRGAVINLELDWWQPNERIIGAIEVVGLKRQYDIQLRTLHTSKSTYEIGDAIPLYKTDNAKYSKSSLCSSKLKISSCISSHLLDMSNPIIVLASSPSDTYTIAYDLYEQTVDISPDDEDVELLIRLVQTELGEDFPLAKFLKRRIGVHSSALPDEIKVLVEELMANGKLQALVATTTIAQGINFPVSAVILGAYNYPYQGPMPIRDFWNLAGRVGRAGQNVMGWVGLSVRNQKDLVAVSRYVQEASLALRSQLIDALEQALPHIEKGFDRLMYYDERWSTLLQYVSHLRRETEQQGVFISRLEEKLHGTLGYRQLSDEKKKFLRAKLRNYATSLTLADAKRSDETGFSTVSVRQMIGKLSSAGLSANDWSKNQLFSTHNSTMKKLVGIMLDTYEIKNSISKLSGSPNTIDQDSIARMMIDWVNGQDIVGISSRSYPHDAPHIAVQKTARSLYSIVANAGTWGIAALQKMPTSGVSWDKLSDLEKKSMANIPAYLHYGVNTDEGVLMRKNNVPRSIANSLGALYRKSIGGDIFSQPSSNVLHWLFEQKVVTWDEIRPKKTKLSGRDYRKIWMKLNGIDE